MSEMWKLSCCSFDEMLYGFVFSLISCNESNAGAGATLVVFTT